MRRSPQLHIEKENTGRDQGDAPRTQAQRTTTNRDVSLSKEHSWAQWEHLGLARVLIICNSAKLARELGAGGRAVGVPGPTLPGPGTRWAGPRDCVTAASCLSAPSRTLPAGPVRGAAEMDVQSCPAVSTGVQTQRAHTFPKRNSASYLGPLQVIFVGGDLCHTEKRSQDTAPEKGGSRTTASPGRRCREPVAEGTPERTPGARPRPEGSPAPSPCPCTLCVRVLS